MKNFVQEGGTISVAAPYDLLSGNGALVGSLFGVAVKDAASGAAIDIVTRGVFNLTALSTDTGSVGTLVYWDDTNKRVTTTASGNTKIGLLVAAKSNGDAYATVRLNGSF